MLLKCLSCSEFMKYQGDDEEGLELYICPKCGFKIALDFVTEAQQ